MQKKVLREENNDCGNECFWGVVVNWDGDIREDEEFSEDDELSDY